MQLLTDAQFISLVLCELQSPSSYCKTGASFSKWCNQIKKHFNRILWLMERTSEFADIFSTSAITYFCHSLGFHMPMLNKNNQPTNYSKNNFKVNRYLTLCLYIFEACKGPYLKQPPAELCLPWTLSMHLFWDAPTSLMSRQGDSWQDPPAWGCFSHRPSSSTLM